MSGLQAQLDLINCSFVTTVYKVQLGLTHVWQQSTVAYLQSCFWKGYDCRCCNPLTQTAAKRAWKLMNVWYVCSDSLLYLCFKYYLYNKADSCPHRLIEYNYASTLLSSTYVTPICLKWTGGQWRFFFPLPLSLIYKHTLFGNTKTKWPWNWRHIVWDYNIGVRMLILGFYHPMVPWTFSLSGIQQIRLSLYQLISGGHMGWCTLSYLFYRLMVVELSSSWSSRVIDPNPDSPPSRLYSLL